MYVRRLDRASSGESALIDEITQPLYALPQPPRERLSSASCPCRAITRRTTSAAGIGSPASRSTASKAAALAAAGHVRAAEPACLVGED